MSSALDVEKENQWKKREAAFRVQIGQLEAAMQADVGDKGNLLERMVRVKGRNGDTFSATNFYCVVIG